MASLSINVTSTKGQISWSITGLGGAWNTSNYKKAGFATSQASSSGSASLSGILTSVSPSSSSGTNTYTPTYYYYPSNNLSDDDAVTVYGYCQAANGKYYPAGSVTIVPVHLWMDSESMSYYYANVGGYSFKITATSISTAAFWVPKNTSITLSSITPASGWSNLRWHYNNSESYDYANTYTDSPDNNIGTTYGRYGYYEALSYTPPATSYTITLYRNNSSSDATFDTITTAATTSATKTAYLGEPSDYGWSKSGYSFTYWTTGRSGGGTAYVGGQNQSFTGDTTLYAQWELIPTYQYSVTIYRNYGVSAYSTYYTTTGTSTTQTIDMPSCPWIRTGYDFVGYNTNSSGTGTWYYAGTTYNLTSNKTLYAIWSIQTFSCGVGYVTGCSGMASALTVSNGTTTAGTVSVDYGGTATWSCAPATGYQFVGWFANQAGTGTAVSTDATYSETITGARTLYAKFAAITYTAAASSSGFGCCFSSVSVDNASPAYGSTVTFTANLNAGYTFRGWYDGNGTRVSQLASYPVTVTGNITLYARASVQWTNTHAAGTSAISKEEWDRLQTFITQRNGATFSYTASVGASLPAALYNDTKNGIGTGTTVAKGQAITQALLDELITNANNL